MREWTLDRRPGKWIVNEKLHPASAARGQTNCHSHDPPAVRRIWQDADRVRSFIDEWAQLAPELFPEGFDQGYCLHGFGRESLKLPA